MTNKTILDIKAGIAFSINAGNVVEEPFPGAYNNIVFITWLLAFYWDAQKEICDMYKEMDGENNMEFHAAVLYPKGKVIYQILW